MKPVRISDTTSREENGTVSAFVHPSIGYACLGADGCPGLSTPDAPATSHDFGSAPDRADWCASMRNMAPSPRDPAPLALYHIFSPRVPRSGVPGGGAVPIGVPPS